MYGFWWPPIKLERMSNYYIMPCTPGNVFESHRLSSMGKYNFQIRWLRKIRGRKFYVHRHWKGKWKH